VQILGVREAPRRRPFEDVVFRVFEHRPPHVLVGVEDVDAPRTCLVRGPRNGPRERRMLDVARDVEVLAGAQVEADADGELRVPAQEVVRRHVAILGIRARRIPLGNDAGNSRGNLPVPPNPLHGRASRWLCIQTSLVVNPAR
jgi:hypothetical protein